MIDANEQLVRNYLRAMFDALHKSALGYYLGDADTAKRAQRLSEIVTKVKGLGDQPKASEGFGIAAPLDIGGVCLGCPDSKCVGGICLGVDIGATDDDIAQAGVKHETGPKHNAKVAAKQKKKR
jgi:hypothetical protein